jgi:hypothetical protein
MVSLIRKRGILCRELLKEKKIQVPKRVGLR